MVWKAHQAEKDLDYLIRSRAPRTIEDLTRAVASQRDREIEIVEFQFPPRSGMSGLWIAQRDRDIIAHAPSTRLRRDAITGHELGHILCGHKLQRGDDLGLEGIDVYRYLAREHYDSHREAEAERVGTLIAAALRQPSLTGWVSSRLR